MAAAKLVAGIVLIILGVVVSLAALTAITFSSDWTEPWDLWATIRVLIAGSLAFIPGVWLVVRAYCDSGRVRAGLTLIIAGATYSLVAWGLAEASTYCPLCDHAPSAPPTSHYVFAVLVGVVPVLIGVVLLGSRSFGRTLRSTSRRVSSPPPPSR